MKNRLIAKLHILMNQKEIDADTKADIYSGYGVRSSKEMTLEQLSDLVSRLEGKQVYGAAPVSVSIKALRSEVLLLLTASHWSSNSRKQGLNLPNDWSVLNPFIERHTGKLLPAMSEEELVGFKKKLLAIRKTGWYYRGSACMAPSPAEPTGFTKNTTRSPQIIVITSPVSENTPVN